ncbi:MAG TPA: hypothetical protein VHB21_06810 [Minicystis sp.]|nr:hypothetical protein [Minicystis sp.]
MRPLDLLLGARAPLRALVLGGSVLLASGAARAQDPDPPPPAPAPQPAYAPPPGYAAPPAYAPQPGYAPPQAGYAPGYAPPAYPPYPVGQPPVVVVQGRASMRPVPWVIDDWDAEAPAPPGYNKTEGVNSRVITTGAVLLATAWLSSTVVATVGTSTHDAGGTSPPPSAWTPLFVPLAGPFIAAGTLHPSGAGVGAIAMDGGIQVVGALGILMGIVDQRAKLVRYDASAPVPAVTPTGAGGGARTAFLASGGILGGVGALMTIAGGITWLVAAGESASLSSECPHHACVRGTAGGDALVTARNTAKATDVLLAGGLPALGIGTSLVLVGGGLGKGSVRATPIAGMGVGGMRLEGSF